MNCAVFRQAIDRYLTGDLEGGDYKAFEGHAAVCGACRKALEQERGFEASLKSNLQMRQPPAQLLNNVMAAVRKVPPHPWVRFVEFVRRPSIDPVFAGIVFVMMAVIISFRPVPIPEQALKQHRNLLEGPVRPSSWGDMEETMVYLQMEVGYRVQAPHLNLKEVKFVTGSIVEFRGEEVIQLVFAKGDQLISAFLLPSTLAPSMISGKILDESNAGLVTAHRSGGMENILCYHKQTRDACLLISSLSREQLFELMG